MAKERYDWLDVLKCIGMFEIFIGHTVSAGALVHAFVFTNHVPLFFFMSGCTESLARERSFLETLKAKTGSILVPFYFFCVLLIVFRLMAGTIGGAEGLKQVYMAFVQGAIRNTVFDALWFLSCLWVTSIMFCILKKILRKGYLVLLASLLVFCFANTVIHPGVDPQWYYNVDSALYYLLYYALGFVLFPRIRSGLSSVGTCPRVTGAAILLFVVSSCYSAALFFNYDVLVFLSGIPMVRLFLDPARAMIVIAFLIFVSYFLRRSGILQRLGRGSLYLCGSETIAKMLVPALLSMVGLELQLNSPLATFLYMGLLMCGIVYLLEPIERKGIDAIRRFPAYLVGVFRKGEDTSR